MKKYCISLFLLLFAHGFASSPASIPKAVIEQEIEKHSQHQIPPQTPIKTLNVSDIKHRSCDLIYERFNHRPQDIFFITSNGQKFIGRKLISNLYLEGKIQGMKCSQITAPMILGIFEKEQIVSDGVLLFYHPLENGEKLALFEGLKSSLKSDLHFPYPYLDDQNQEAIWPIDFWNLTPDHVDNLDGGEVAFRNYTLSWLSQFDLDGKVIYDPSCSTGKFLSEIKKTYPQSFTIGQDINPDMVDFAKQRSLIDEVYLGNAITSPIANNSVDYIFIRFLNLEVVEFEQSLDLFAQIANRCRDGGHLILFGHTPVLPNAEWFRILGLEVEQNIGYYDQSIFQFYVLKKLKEVPLIQFKDHTFLKGGDL